MGGRIRKGPQRKEEGGHSTDVGENKEYMIPKESMSAFMK